MTLLFVKRLRARKRNKDLSFNTRPPQVQGKQTTKDRAMEWNG